MTATLPPLRALASTLVVARDDQIGRVVAMIDALPDRGAADSLIAPLRGRLAQLRPGRPLRFARLMFLPLDPVILPGGGWRRGMLAVPRTAIAPLAGVVHAALGADAQAIEATLAGHSTDDVALIAAIGGELWPRAGAALRAAAADGAAAEAGGVDWSASTGLADAEFAPMAAAVGAILGQGSALNELAGRVTAGLPVDGTLPRAILAAVAAAGPEAHSLAFTLLLARMPDPAPLLLAARDTLAGGQSAALRVAADRAVDSTLDRLEGGEAVATLDPRIDLADAAGELKRVAALLAGLADDAPRPDRMARIDRLRRSLDSACRARFTTGLADGLLRPLSSLPGPASDADIAQLEGTARDLRHLEGAGRRLGGADSYDAALRAAAARVGAPAAGVTLMDRVRLVEILAGPETALSLLDAA